MTTASQTGSSDGTVKGLMDRARDGATAQLTSQKDRATDGLGSFARAVRGSSQPFRENQQDALAQYVERAADQIDSFAARLRDRDVQELFDEAQQFARRQPAVFLGAAFAAGVIAARFLKSSADADRRRTFYNDNRAGAMRQPARDWRSAGAVPGRPAGGL